MEDDILEKYETGSKVLILESDYTNNSGIVGMTGVIIDEDCETYDYAVEFFLTGLNRKTKDFFNHKELSLVLENANETP